MFFWSCLFERHKVLSWCGCIGEFQVGWLYGSITEDVLTGLSIHEKGWRSEFCTPNPIAFTGCAPEGLPASMSQQRRWATGLLEIFFSKHCPVIGTLYGKLRFRQCLAYVWLVGWGFQPLFEICYACLLTYCSISNSNLLPQVSINKDNHNLFSMNKQCKKENENKNMFGLVEINRMEWNGIRFVLFEYFKIE